MSGGTGLPRTVPIKPASDAEVDEVYQEYDEVIAARTSRRDCIHLPDSDGDRMCDGCGSKPTNQGYRTVSIATYPKGYIDICKICISVRRGDIDG